LVCLGCFASLLRELEAINDDADDNVEGERDKENKKGDEIDRVKNRGLPDVWIPSYL